MKAEEFRIGNLCQEKYSKQVIKVIGISDKDIFFSGKFTGKWQSEKIPLTMEWLLKFGYSFIKEGHFAIAGHLIWVCNDLLICDKNGVILLYVHQLQNLYFSLTGHELILKE